MKPVILLRAVDDNWIVIELNDGTMSGLSAVNADEFYKNLRKKL